MLTQDNAKKQITQKRALKGSGYRTLRQTGTQGRASWEECWDMSWCVAHRAGGEKKALEALALPSSFSFYKNHKKLRNEKNERKAKVLLVEKSSPAAELLIFYLIQF